MKKLLVLLLPLVAADLYKETQNFQYSRSDSDAGEKKGFYESQSGNMGGNFEASRNMDTPAQRQMKGLMQAVGSQLGINPGAIGTGSLDQMGTGSVYGSASTSGKTFGAKDFSSGLESDRYGSNHRVGLGLESERYGSSHHTGSAGYDESQREYSTNYANRGSGQRVATHSGSTHLGSDGVRRSGTQSVLSGGERTAGTRYVSGGSRYHTASTADDLDATDIHLGEIGTSGLSSQSNTRRSGTAHGGNRYVANTRYHTAANAGRYDATTDQLGETGTLNQDLQRTVYVPVADVREHTPVAGMTSTGTRVADTRYQTSASGYEQQQSEYATSGSQNRGATIVRPVTVPIRPGNTVRLTVRPNTVIPIQIPVQANTRRVDSGYTQEYDSSNSHLTRNIGSESQIGLTDSENTVRTHGAGVNAYTASDGARTMGTTKGYQSSYSYQKEWERHGTAGDNIHLVPVTDMGTVAQNRDRLLVGGVNVGSEDTGSTVYNSGSRVASTGRRYDTSQTYQENKGETAESGYRTDSRQAAGQVYGANTHNQGSRQNVYDQTAEVQTKPKSYQSSYSYHKSWEKHGTPYTIQPGGHESTAGYGENIEDQTQDMSHMTAEQRQYAESQRSASASHSRGRQYDGHDSSFSSAQGSQSGSLSTDMAALQERLRSQMGQACPDCATGKTKGYSASYSYSAQRSYGGHDQASYNGEQQNQHRFKRGAYNYHTGQDYNTNYHHPDYSSGHHYPDYHSGHYPTVHHHPGYRHYAHYNFDHEQDMGQQTEDLGQLTMDLGQQTEDLGQLTMDLGQQTEGFGQQTENLEQQSSKIDKPNYYHYSYNSEVNKPTHTYSHRVEKESSSSFTIRRKPEPEQPPSSWVEDLQPEPKIHSPSWHKQYENDLKQEELEKQISSLLSSLDKAGEKVDRTQTNRGDINIHASKPSVDTEDKKEDLGEHTEQAGKPEKYVVNRGKLRTTGKEQKPKEDGKIPSTWREDPAPKSEDLGQETQDFGQLTEDLGQQTSLWDKDLPQSNLHFTNIQAGNQKYQNHEVTHIEVLHQNTNSPALEHENQKNQDADLGQQTQDFSQSQSFSQNSFSSQFQVGSQVHQSSLEQETANLEQQTQDFRPKHRDIQPVVGQDYAMPSIIQENEFFGQKNIPNQYEQQSFLSYSGMYGNNKENVPEQSSQIFGKPDGNSNSRAITTEQPKAGAHYPQDKDFVVTHHHHDKDFEDKVAKQLDDMMKALGSTNFHNDGHTTQSKMETLIKNSDPVSTSSEEVSKPKYPTAQNLDTRKKIGVDIEPDQNFGSFNAQDQKLDEWARKMEQELQKIDNREIPESASHIKPKTEYNPNHNQKSSEEKTDKDKWTTHKYRGEGKRVNSWNQHKSSEEETHKDNWNKHKTSEEEKHVNKYEQNKWNKHKSSEEETHRNNQNKHKSSEEETHRNNQNKHKSSEEETHRNNQNKHKSSEEETHRNNQNQYKSSEETDKYKRDNHRSFLETYTPEHSKIDRTTEKNIEPHHYQPKVEVTNKPVVIPEEKETEPDDAGQQIQQSPWEGLDVDLGYHEMDKHYDVGEQIVLLAQLDNEDMGQQTMQEHQYTEQQTLGGSLHVQSNNQEKQQFTNQDHLNNNPPSDSSGKDNLQTHDKEAVVEQTTTMKPPMAHQQEGEVTTTPKPGFWRRAGGKVSGWFG